MQVLDCHARPSVYSKGVSSSRGVRIDALARPDEGLSAMRLPSPSTLGAFGAGGPSNSPDHCVSSASFSRALLRQQVAPMRLLTELHSAPSADAASSQLSPLLAATPLIATAAARSNAERSRLAAQAGGPPIALPAQVQQVPRLLGR